MRASTGIDLLLNSMPKMGSISIKRGVSSSDLIVEAYHHQGGGGLLQEEILRLRFPVEPGIYEYKVGFFGEGIEANEVRARMDKGGYAGQIAVWAAYLTYFRLSPGGLFTTVPGDDELIQQGSEFCTLILNMEASGLPLLCFREIGKPFPPRCGFISSAKCFFPS